MLKTKRVFSVSKSDQMGERDRQTERQTKSKDKHETQKQFFGQSDQKMKERQRGKGR